MTAVQDFWNELQDKAYMSAVINYRDNRIRDLLKKYGVKEICTHCGNEKRGGGE